MSRLVKPESQETPTPREIRYLSNTDIQEVLKTCQRISIDNAGRALGDAYKNFLDAIASEVLHARSNQKAIEFNEYHRLMRLEEPEAQKKYCAYISEGYTKFQNKNLNSQLSQDEACDADISKELDIDDLRLVEDKQLEEYIALTRIIQNADDYFSEKLWALNQRFSVLNGGSPVSLASNPASPLQFCYALQRTFSPRHIDLEIKHFIFKAYQQSFNETYTWIIDDTNQYLIDQGILPTLKHRSNNSPLRKHSKEKSTQRANTTNNSPNILNEDISADPQNTSSQRAQVSLNENQVERQGELLNEIQSLQSNPLNKPEPPPNIDPNIPMVDSTEIITALNALQPKDTNNATQHGGFGRLENPANVSYVTNQLSCELQSKQQKPIVKENDMHTIDLVGMMFEFMLKDNKLPDKVKTLLSHLHTPFLKLAFIDKGFFENKDHPARVLLNNLDRAGSQWVEQNGHSGFEIFDKIRDIVYQIIHCSNNEIKLITELLLDFNATIKKAERRRALTEKRAQEKAKGEDKLHSSKLEANKAIYERIKDKDLPSIVLLFLLQSWSVYMTFTLLRHSKKSDPYLNSLYVIDNVVWCSIPKDNAHDQLKQKEMFKPMMSDIKFGLKQTGCSDETAKKFIRGIVSMVQLTLKAKKAKPALPEERDKIVSETAKKISIIQPQEPSTREERKMIENLRMAEFGTWIERQDGYLFKISWYNIRTDEYMLVNRRGQHEITLPALGLARELIAENMKIISGSSRPFFERALTHIRNTLRDQK